MAASLLNMETQHSTLSQADWIFGREEKIMGTALLSVELLWVYSGVIEIRIWGRICS